MNANLVFSPRGVQAARYDKMHLFAYDNGRERYDEARTLRAGRTPVAFDAGGLRVGLSVCYDLRFPELYRALARPPCDLLSVPSAFTHTTGAAHWEVLLRARAIENQCFMIGVNRTGFADGLSYLGGSTVFDPWGDRISPTPVHATRIATIDTERVRKLRESHPFLQDRVAASS